MIRFSIISKSWKPLYIVRPSLIFFDSSFDFSSRAATFDSAFLLAVNVGRVVSSTVYISLYIAIVLLKASTIADAGHPDAIQGFLHGWGSLFKPQ